ncbi:hypothetical protein HGA64_01745, partial [Candidatus Falkowbacteria bacterium]|nr:hypothetical protein [Candidatus Falkowbacteria bacterium]
MHPLKKAFYAKVILVMVMAQGLAGTANAASLGSVRDVLGSSSPGATTSHSISFIFHQSLLPGDYIDVILPTDFASGINSAGLTCPVDMISDVGFMSTGTSTARCVAINPIPATTSILSMQNVTNPSVTGSYAIYTSTNDSLGTVKESAVAMVAVVDTVSVSASVSASLTFNISPVATSTNVNGADTTLTSATFSLEFGLLTVSSSSVIAQELSVITNADDGYSVTVEQNQNLTSNSGSDIDSFINGTTTSPLPWQSPENTLDQEWTYGHFGITSEDTTLSNNDWFGNNLWEGFNNSDPIEVMYHNGPADGLAVDKGLTRVAYRIEVSPLQEA